MRTKAACIAAAVLLGGAVQASAADNMPLTVPRLALDPQESPSLWSGLRIGSDVFAVSGGKGMKGGIGATLRVGYDYEFENNVVLGVQASTGFTPASFVGSRLRGFDFATADVKVGYDMGRVMPYMIGSVALLKPNYDTGLAGFASGASFSNLVSGGRDLDVAGRVGAGVEYAITDRLHVGLEVSVSRGQNWLYPY
ncbi:outer membrane protein [Chelatococcus reniformis]|uniref:Outer membrane protein beta-barrel domain-containing protein n=1 Tax=Chelatococcus reniformis TaxID=1494448 RepID=A0A916XK81_9HYPH|nr:outer membrane beta-barrel protein [Chelatococcus reniformis]GGC80431.1 hypothetical protein GCM10010994_43040 [Chelatococcus reniformis]